MRVDRMRNKVKKVEGFDVLIGESTNYGYFHSYRGHKQLDDNFNFKFSRAAANNMTVAQWKQRRIPEDVDAEVLDGDGEIVHGRTKLCNVRRSYV